MAKAAETDQKKRRAYHSPRRKEQAEATRREILDSAERLFLDNGYVATSMAAIAKEAGVALKTVYLAFETKSGLLRALWHRNLRGGREDVPVAEQSWFLEVLEEPDPAEALRLNARNSKQVKTRIAPLGAVLLSGAAADPEVEALSERIWSQFYENQLEVVKALHRRGALKKGLGVKRAADVLWTLNHPRTYLLLLDRGWTPEQYERWLAEITISELLA
jgi:TetR/AcrR family transcriptional regulator, regulator of autoinduction and epiphytic fitness